MFIKFVTGGKVYVTFPTSEKIAGTPDFFSHFLQQSIEKNAERFSRRRALLARTYYEISLDVTI
jgi:hypothetical protein